MICVMTVVWKLTTARDNLILKENLASKIFETFFLWRSIDARLLLRESARR